MLKCIWRCWTFEGFVWHCSPSFKPNDIYYLCHGHSRLDQVCQCMVYEGIKEPITREQLVCLLVTDLRWVCSTYDGSVALRGQELKDKHVQRVGVLHNWLTNENKVPTQSKVDQLIVNFIVSYMEPLSVMEDQSFIDLVTGIHKRKVKTRKTGWYVRLIPS